MEKQQLRIERDKDWEFHLRSLSVNSRDSSTADDPASDPSLLHSVRKLYEMCKEAEQSEDLVARVYPQFNKIFQRSVASLSQSRTSNGLLLLAILQFFLDFGEAVLHDADPSLRTFFRTCLSREFADPVVAEASLEFMDMNKAKLLSSFPTLLPQFFPLLLKLIAWNGEKLEKLFLKIFPGMMSPGSFLPLFPSLVDLPILVVALEKVERSSGSLIGSSIASIQKSTAPEMLLAFMDEAYAGGGDLEAEDNDNIDVADSVFLELLKDENDGLSERHWTSPGMTAALQTAINTSQSERLREALHMEPRFLDMYFSIALRDVNKSLLCALIPLLMSRNSTLFPDKGFSYEDNILGSQALKWYLGSKIEIKDLGPLRTFQVEVVRSRFISNKDYDLTKPSYNDRVSEVSPDIVQISRLSDCQKVRIRLLEFMLAAFQRSPNFIALLKKPIIDRLGEAYDSPAKTELALQLCWAIGEHGGGGKSHKDAARELFETLELLLYENSRLGSNQETTVNSEGASSRKSSQARLLCFVVTAIAKLATYHRELLPRARLFLAKVARSRNTDTRVCRRAHDYLGLMNEPAICMSILGPSSGYEQSPGNVNWSSGGSKMIAHIPFYILSEQEGPPFHDFSFSDLIPSRDEQQRT